MRTTSCQNNSCCFHNFWNFTFVLVRGVHAQDCAWARAWARAGAWNWGLGLGVGLGLGLELAGGPSFDTLI